MTNTYQEIRSAILEKKQIHAIYHDHLRKMCPHILGYSKSGEPMCLFYQFEGSGSRGPLTEGAWRCMKVNELSGVKSVEGKWHTEETHGGKKRPCVNQIDVEV